MLVCILISRYQGTQFSIYGSRSQRVPAQEMSQQKHRFRENSPIVPPQPFAKATLIFSSQMNPLRIPSQYVDTSTSQVHPYPLAAPGHAPTPIHHTHLSLLHHLNFAQYDLRLVERLLARSHRRRDNFVLHIDVAGVPWLLT